MTNPIDQWREDVRLAAESYGVSAAEVMSGSREWLIVRARDAACVRMRDRGMTYGAIARLFRKDHTSIISAVRRYNARQARKT